MSVCICMCIILHLHILQLSKQGKNGEQGEKGVAGRPGQKVRRSSYSHLHVKCDSSDIYASLSNGVVFFDDSCSISFCTFDECTLPSKRK